MLQQLKLIIGFSLLLAIPCMAASNTQTINNKPISIDADHQEIDIKTNTVTFTGNVIIIQDSLKVTAEKVIINNMQSKNNQNIIAYGEPVYFTQTMENNRIIEGQAKELNYDVKLASVTLIGKAEINQQDNQIRSEKIIYKVNEQHIIAQGSATQRVTTTIIPNQLKETDNK